MDADNVSIIFADVSGAEWCDVVVNIQPSSLLLAGTVNDAGSTTTDFDTTLTGYGNDFFNGAFILFTDGALQGQARKISDYVSTSGNIIVAALNTAPTNGDPFVIVGRSE
jgi:hypothetical protein